MKKTLKMLAIAMAIVLALFALASCGGQSGTPDEPANGDSEKADAPKNDVKGAMDEHGYYKVFVPEGYTLKHEDLWGDNNPKSFNINNDESSFTYFMFNIYDMDSIEMSIGTTKEMNEGAADVTVEIGGRTWTGVAYDSLGIACFSLYADFGGNYVLVSGAGNAYDSALVDTVLGSLEVNVTE